MKNIKINGINYHFSEDINVDITINKDNDITITTDKEEKDNDVTISTEREESVEWIMSTLYGDIDLKDSDYHMLKDTVTSLVDKWEDILNEVR